MIGVSSLSDPLELRLLRTLSILGLCLGLTAAAFAESTPKPNPTAKGHAMKGSAMHGDAMKGSAMHGDAAKGSAMHGDAMKGSAMHGDGMKGSAMHGDGMKKPVATPTP
jgi:pentapeptide MXKDX repeat protein